MRVRTGRFRSGGQGFPPPHDMTRWPHPRHPMLPIESALIDHLAHTGVIGADIRSVVGCQPTSSALHRSSRLPVSSFQRAYPRPRLAFRLLWPLLTSHGISSVGSPEVRTRCFPAQPPHFPPRLKPVDFAVLCQLIPPCRPRMQFLFIGSRISPSLPSHGRSPFRSWLQLVFFFSWFYTQRT